jgi:hypothetical protein
MCEPNIDARRAERKHQPVRQYALAGTSQHVRHQHVITQDARSKKAAGSSGY